MNLHASFLWIFPPPDFIALQNLSRESSLTKSGIMLDLYFPDMRLGTEIHLAEISHRRIRPGLTPVHGRGVEVRQRSVGKHALSAEA